MDPIFGAVLEAVNRAGAGIAVFTTVLWWLERAQRIAQAERWETERKAMQDKKDDLLTRVLEAISGLRSIVSGRPPAGQ